MITRFVDFKNWYLNESQDVTLIVTNDAFHDLCDKVKRYIKVTLCGDRELGGPIGGRFDFEKLEILVNTQDVSISDQYLTLLHEFGHYLTFMDYLVKFDKDPYMYGDDIVRRELGAYYHGWWYIIANDLPITKSIWRQAHAEILNAYLHDGKIDINPFDIV